MTRLTCCAAVMLFSIAALLTSCASSDPNERHDIIAPLAPPMELDPTHTLELPTWFSSGVQTLQLSDTGAYKMYEGTNRHAKPIERGRWVRLNYAALTLEPYATGKASAPVRCEIFKDGERMGLRIGTLAPMYSLAGVPMSIEDELIGTWTGPDQRLELRPGMRFAYSRPADAHQKAAIAAITGSWSVSDAGVQLVPETAAMETTTLPIKRDGEKVMLEGFGVALERE